MPKFICNYTITGNIDVTVKTDTMEQAITQSEDKVREVLGDALVRRQYLDLDLEQVEPAQ